MKVRPMKALQRRIEEEEEEVEAEAKEEVVAVEEEEVEEEVEEEFIRMVTLTKPQRLGLQERLLRRLRKRLLLWVTGVC